MLNYIPIEHLETAAFYCGLTGYGQLAVTEWWINGQGVWGVTTEVWFYLKHRILRGW